MNKLFVALAFLVGSAVSSEVYSYAMYLDSACTNKQGVDIPVTPVAIPICVSSVEVSSGCQNGGATYRTRTFVTGCEGNTLIDMEFILDGECNSLTTSGITQYYKSSAVVPCAGSAPDGAPGLYTNLAIIVVALVAALL
eukprot:TRINITY_DN4197_c0_g1_i2.p1 TRINITY_DN4197_c0_g1~~TRINITY_DN4197_c0_g1_i2.p1  ORF type:complete len:139 (+),score=13.23 TRINITY_DN4197_c0_g1_i2:86-502(+)